MLVVLNTGVAGDIHCSCAALRFMTAAALVAWIADERTQIRAYADSRLGQCLRPLPLKAPQTYVWYWVGCGCQHTWRGGVCGIDALRAQAWRGSNACVLSKGLLLRCNEWNRPGFALGTGLKNDSWPRGMCLARSGDRFSADVLCC